MEANSSTIKLMTVWGPFKCQVCGKQRKNWEGRCLWNTETGMRTDFWCVGCFPVEEKATDGAG